MAVEVLEDTECERQGHDRPRACEVALPLTKTHELRRPFDVHFLEQMLVNLVAPGEAHSEMLVEEVRVD